MSVSRTSFYRFFKDRAALLDAPPEQWEAKNTGAFIEAYAETITEAVLNLITAFYDEEAFRAGRSPTASEMARFHARLKFKPHEGGADRWGDRK